MAALLEALQQFRHSANSLQVELNPSLISALLSASGKFPDVLLGEILQAHEEKYSVQGQLELEDDAGLVVLIAAFELLKRPETTQEQLRTVVERLCLPKLCQPNLPPSQAVQLAWLLAHGVEAKAAWGYALASLQSPFQVALGIPPGGTGAGAPSPPQPQITPFAACQLAGALLRRANAAARQGAERAHVLGQEGPDASGGPAARSNGSHLDAGAGEGGGSGTVNCVGVDAGATCNSAGANAASGAANNGPGCGGSGGGGGGGGEGGGNSTVAALQRALVDLYLSPALALLAQTSSDASLRKDVLQALGPPLVEAAMAVGWGSSAAGKGEDGGGGGGTGEGAGRLTGEAAAAAVRRGLWECARALLRGGGAGALQRAEGYALLAFFSSTLLPPLPGTPGEPGGDAAAPAAATAAAAFDVRERREFWAALKAGLVDEDALTQKRARHCLEAALPAEAPPGGAPLSATGGSSRANAKKDSSSRPSATLAAASAVHSGGSLGPQFVNGIEVQEEEEQQEEEEVGVQGSDAGAHADAHAREGTAAGATAGGGGAGAGERERAEKKAAKKEKKEKKGQQQSMRKRDRRANREAQSMGLDALQRAPQEAQSRHARWRAFMLLLDTLDEFGIHLAEAAWAPQMDLLLPFRGASGHDAAALAHLGGRHAEALQAPQEGEKAQEQEESEEEEKAEERVEWERMDVDFTWLPVLWHRGFDHRNPQVRRLVLDSFLARSWQHTQVARALPRAFVLEGLLGALKDPAQHRDFGMGGAYTSATAEAAVAFFAAYSRDLPDVREQSDFVKQLAERTVSEAPSRAGLMTFAMCLQAAATATSAAAPPSPAAGPAAASAAAPAAPSAGTAASAGSGDLSREGEGESHGYDEDRLLEVLRDVVEDAKRHFNPKYRAKISGHVLVAASALLRPPRMSVPAVAHLLSVMPPSLVAPTGALWGVIHAWLHPMHAECSGGDLGSVSGGLDDPALQGDGRGPTRRWLCDGLLAMLEAFFGQHHTHPQAPAPAPAEAPAPAAAEEPAPATDAGADAGGGVFSDEDLEAWAAEARKWTRLLLVALALARGEVQVGETGGEEEDGEESRLLGAVQARLRGGLQSGASGHEHVPAVATQKALLLLRCLLCDCPPTAAAAVGAAAEADGVQARLRSRVVAMLTVRGKEEEEEDEEDTLALVLHLAAKQAAVLGGGDGLEQAFAAEPLPGAVTGRLGGPSQRRLSATAAAAVSSAVLAVQVAAESVTWLWHARPASLPANVHAFLWSFASRVLLPAKAAAGAGAAVQGPPAAASTEMRAEIQLAAYEALASVCQALAETLTPGSLATAASAVTTATVAAATPGSLNAADALVSAIQRDSADVPLARSRRSVLESHKWRCLDHLLSMSDGSSSGNAGLAAAQQQQCGVSREVLQRLLADATDSLERVGEDHMLPLLRATRRLLSLGALRHEADPVQAMRELARAGWAAMVDCNKRKVAPIAAFLSTLFHPAVFPDLAMHVDANAPDGTPEGPLKWLVRRVMEQGGRSPRTMRLAALHLTSLWLRHPRVAACYTPELKQLSLHGAETVDEELDGEIAESQVAAREYATLAQSTDPELIEIFTNSEMYARVAVAIMMHHMARTAASSHPHAAQEDDKEEEEEEEDAAAAARCGRQLLLSLLESAVKDKDLAKELYKKKSAVHRRKVRAWQMLAILSRFVTRAMLPRVTALLGIAIDRNNMPSVRQFVEIFGVHLHLLFPHLVEERLVPLLQQHNMKPQALASYVLIATHVVLHSPDRATQEAMLRLVLPAVLPSMTTHHHNLRSFCQVLVFKVLERFPDCDMRDDSDRHGVPGGGGSNDEGGEGGGGRGGGGGAQLDAKCLRVMHDYLATNVDCTRMRVSVERYLDAFDPVASTTPRGMFVVGSGGESNLNKTLDELPFECAPVAVYDRVAFFLKDARENLRENMAAGFAQLDLEAAAGRVPARAPEEEDEEEGDVDSWRGNARGTHKESLVANGDAAADGGAAPGGGPGALHDYQKKIRIQLAEGDGATSQGPGAALPPDEDAEEELLLATAGSRVRQLAKLQGQRQGLVVVASLIGRIPNLAGLARTCEVFKAGSLVVADASIAEDRQFQMISVTAERWIPMIEVPEAGLAAFLQRKKREGFTLVGLEQTAQSVPIHSYAFPHKTVLVLGREKEGIPVSIIQALDVCVEIPQAGLIRSLNVHVSGAIATWEYTRQHLPS